MQTTHTTKEEIPELIAELRELLISHDHGCMCKSEEGEYWSKVANFVGDNFSPEQAFMIKQLVEPLNDLVWKKNSGGHLPGNPVHGSVVNEDREELQLTADKYQLKPARTISRPYDQRCYNPEKLFGLLAEAMTRAAV